jgi:L-alanine-DL-glutamate epimerase-like enolase superfamily enzyme
VIIASVDVRLISIPLRYPYVFGRGSVSTFDNIVATIRTTSGPTGVGECVTKALVTDIGEAGRIVRDKLAPRVIGKRASDIENIIQDLRPYAGGDQATLAAIDLALWDLMGREYGVPAYALLGGKCAERIPVDYTLALASPEEMAQKAVSMMVKGYQTFVVKTGKDIPSAVARVAAVREAVGDGVHLRVDANASYSLAEALDFMTAVRPYNLEFIEQPLQPGDIAGLKELARKTGVPICIDEGLTTPSEAIELAKSGAVSVFNVGVPKVGGLLLAKRIAAIAEASEIPCILGGRLAYEVARLAGRHFVVSTPIACTGLAHTGAGPASQSLTGNITKDVVSYEDIAENHGFVLLGDGPGLGFEIDARSLERYSRPIP